MTYFLIKYEDKVRSGFFEDEDPVNDYVIQHKTVKTLEEVEEWATKNYNEKHPPYAIEGKKIEFDFTRAVIVIARSKD